jgi:phosphonopyruvate decarboxylase
MIALSIAEQKKNIKVWCVDGDGAFLMHMGAAALIGSRKPENFIHVLINNRAHESVGGMPTIAGDIDINSIVRACGYKKAYSASDSSSLKDILEKAKKEIGPVLVQVDTNLSSRENLGRPSTTPKENKASFMNMLKNV